MTPAFSTLVNEIRACTACRAHLPHPPKPVFQLHPDAVIAITGQAPGVRAHASGRPFTDPSGERLRSWLGVSDTEFYTPSLFAVVPAGFCFPGLTASGADKLPRKECAPLWRERVFSNLTNVQCVILAGASAHAAHWGGRRGQSVTDTVSRWREFAPAVWTLPHPSWRNNAWLKKHPWFSAELVPALRQRIRTLLDEV